MAGAEVSLALDGACDATLVIPTFREIEFDKALDRLLDYLSQNTLGRTEILVVDDSDDEARAELRKTIGARRSRVPGVDLELIEGPRLGKGAAVRKAALRARGAVVLVIDADLLVPFHNLHTFGDEIRRGADIVIGERPRDRYRGKPLRHFVSRALYFIQVTFVFHEARFSDTQCGFKAFRNDILKELARGQVVAGGIYDLEYLYAATLAKRDIRQIHVEPTAETRPSRIDVWRCIRVDSMEIVRFKLRGVAGRYG
jgi:glycosyltransferase involved in cell wall biosynthesis